MPSRRNVSAASAARSTAAETVSRSSASNRPARDPPGRGAGRRAPRRPGAAGTPASPAARSATSARCGRRPPPSRRARNRPSGSATSSATTSRSGGLDLVEAREGRHRLAAQVHERRAASTSSTASPSTLAFAASAPRLLAPAVDAPPAGQLVGHQEADVVPRLAVLGPGIAEPGDQLHAVPGSRLPASVRASSTSSSRRPSPRRSCPS